MQEADHGERVSQDHIEGIAAEVLQQFE